VKHALTTALIAVVDHNAMYAMHPSRLILLAHALFANKIAILMLKRRSARSATNRALLAQQGTLATLAIPPTTSQMT